MNPTKEYAIGLDIGGTKILAAVIDQEGQIVRKTEEKTLPELGEAGTIQRILAAVDTLLDSCGEERNHIRGIGIATAGVINSRTTEVVFANNLGWKNVPIGAIITERFQLPAKISNDANAATVSEWLWGAGQGKENLIYITVSTGVGAGIISGGRLITGVTDSAGEFGHISIDLEGPMCTCGNRGCLELYTSGTAIAKQAIQRLENGETSSVLHEKKGSFSWITAKEVTEAASLGDPFSRDVVFQVGKWLGAGVTNLIHLFNPEVIVFGGGVMNNGDVLLPVLQETIDERCIPNMARQVQLVKSQVGKEAGVMGAAGLFFS